MISVKKKTSEVHVINKKTCARPGKKEAELHEFLEQYLRIFRAISTSNPTYSVYMGSIFKHYMEHILSILECGSRFCMTMLCTSHFRKNLETSVINHRNGSGMVREWVVSRSSVLERKRAMFIQMYHFSEVIKKRPLYSGLISQPAGVL